MFLVWHVTAAFSSTTVSVAVDFTILLSTTNGQMGQLRHLFMENICLLGLPVILGIFARLKNYELFRVSCRQLKVDKEKHLLNEVILNHCSPVFYDYFLHRW